MTLPAPVDPTPILKHAHQRIDALLDSPCSSDEVHHARLERAGAIWNEAAAKFANGVGAALAAIIRSSIKE